MNLKEIEKNLNRVDGVGFEEVEWLIAKVKELEKASDGLLFYLEDNVMPPIACTRDLRSALGDK